MVLAFHKSIPCFSYSAVNYSPNRLKDLLTSLTNGGFKPDSLTLTFDDGYDHLRDTLPEMRKRFDVRIVVFVPTAMIGKTNRWDYSHFLQPLRHLSADGILELHRAGIEFGSHGHSHTDLTRLDTASLDNELGRSKAELEDILGEEITGISYPFGRRNDVVTDSAFRAGYREGYTLRFPTVSDPDLSQGRFAVYGYDTPLSVRCKLTPGPARAFEHAKAWVTNGLSIGTSLLNRFRP